MPCRKEKEDGKDDNGLVVSPRGAPRKPFSCFLSMNVVTAGEGTNLLDEKANSVILAVDQIDPGSVPRRQNVRKDSVTANPYGNMGPEADRGMPVQLNP